MNTSHTTIATLIPAYNEGLVIAGAIEALLESGISNTDIYVVDDKSTDDTAAIAIAAGVNVCTVPVNGGKAAAQIYALSHFQLFDTYDYVIFLDGDSKVDIEFYNAMKDSAIEYPEVGLFVGQVKSVENSHVFSAYRAYEYTYSHDLAKEAQNKFNVVYVSPGCASMYKTSVLKHLVIDSTTLAEDMDLTIQTHRLKKRVMYVSDAKVFTQDPSTMHDYGKQVVRWYRGFWQIIKKHKVFGIGPKSGVDFYMWMIVFDAIVFNKIFYLTAIFMLFPNISIAAILLDIGITFLIACYSGFRTRRFDVVYKFPVYYWLGFYNLYAFIKSFVEVIVMRKTLLDWNKVTRYDFNTHN